jgi:dTMP kinase
MTIRGRFITLEGGEGAGKTTQIARLADRLRACGISVLTTREPGGAPGADSIRALLVSGATDKWDPISETLLMYAARRQHLTQTINPALARGEWVLCDRFADSTLAYQGYGHGVSQTFIAGLCDAVVGGDGPDLTLILDMPVETGLSRAGARNAEAAAGTRAAEDRFERMGMAFHERLRAGFRDIAAQEPGRCAIVDATGEIEAVSDAIWQEVRTRLAEDLAGAA